MALFRRALNLASTRCVSLVRNGVVRPKIPLTNFGKVRHYAGAYEAEGKTNAVVLNQDFGAPLMIDAFSMVGFTFNNGLSVIGPIAIFPNSVLSWDAGGLSDINEDSLSLFWVLEPKVDILVIGVGSKEEAKSPELRRIISLIRGHRLHLEVLPTESACAVYNFLNAEGRFVGAALIPPKYIEGPGELLSVAKSQIQLGMPPSLKIE